MEFTLEQCNRDLATHHSDEAKIDTLFYRFVLLGDRRGVVSCINLQPRKRYFPMYSDSKPTLDFMLKFYSLVPETDPLDLVKCVNHNSHSLQAVLSHPKWDTLNFINFYEVIDREIVSSQNRMRDVKACFENILRLMRLVPNIVLFGKSQIPVNGDCLVVAKRTKSLLLNVECERRRDMYITLNFYGMKITSTTLYTYSIKNPSTF